MPIANADVAAVFNEIADLLELQGASIFRIRAYRNAARMLGDLGRSIQAMVEHGEDLDALPGIGADLAAKIVGIVNTGSCPLLNQLRAQGPPGVVELLRIPGIGPRRARTLQLALGIRTLEDMQRAISDGRLGTVRGFGPKTQQRIRESIAAHQQADRRFRLPMAMQVAEARLASLAAEPGVLQAQAAGSLRRRRDTVGDIDLVVAAGPGSSVTRRFAAAADVATVLAKGATRAGVVLANGMQVDLRAVPPESFGAALLYFTGSKSHNIALRQRARNAGLKLNEYGVFREDRRIAGDTEASVYRALGLPFIEPELREDRGEIEAALANGLPALVTLDDLRGDLHAHTRDSDGLDTLAAMARAARARGWQYMAVTDHSSRLALAHGLDAGRLAQQIDRIDALNARHDGFVVLKGVEVDILKDGSLDLPEDVLRRLELVVGAVHSAFDLPRDRQTDRLLRAMDHPCFSILAHPTGRLIGERPPCEIDLQRVIRKARERGCFLELNAQPMRLDLNDIACRMAREEGVRISIASDAHSTLDFDHLRYGIGQARRGWLEPGDVLNTRSLDALRPLLAATMDRVSHDTPSPAV
ncbi:putative DNA polymerase/3'-5' exonuclease PolX [Variovorax paradoxus B4]|uniref:DNA polymerase beta n=1 Tax=Variovorax paradoxus B4 TaxID=1246301 RepID=T1XK87_VARPD|nr:DNA polymerase/3'-5' exonuclease PolX [Variovorax paradoxus]AGU52971.1 putative DNA polymerase/3'-5' exonuclease PolX [Variovorax paradoxus B4]